MKLQFEKKCVNTHWPPAPTLSIPPPTHTHTHTHTPQSIIRSLPLKSLAYMTSPCDVCNRFVYAVHKHRCCCTSIVVAAFPSLLLHFHFHRCCCISIVVAALPSLLLHFHFHRCCCTSIVVAALPSLLLHFHRCCCTSIVVAAFPSLCTHAVHKLTKLTGLVHSTRVNKADRSVGLPLSPCGTSA